MSRSTRRTRLWRGLALVALALVVVFAVAGATLASDNGRSATVGEPNNSTLVLYSTTSVRDSGLMQNVVFPAYNAAHPGVTIQPIYGGSGASIQAARDGLADVLIVHSPVDEKTLFTADPPVATLRLPFAYNYFTVVGPKSDPAGISTATSAAQAFRRIAHWGKTLAAGRVAFVSRGDKSGTNSKELALWASAGVKVSAPPSWYITAAGGMLPCLQVTAEKRAYTLTDTGTWLANQANLRPLYRKLTKKADLKNQYSVILLNQALHNQVASTNAEWLAAYLVSYKGQKAIARYGKAQYGESLFFPNAYTVSKKF